MKSAIELKDNLFRQDGGVYCSVCGGSSNICLISLRVVIYSRTSGIGNEATFVLLQETIATREETMRLLARRRMNMAGG